MEPIQDIPNFDTFEYQYSKGKNFNQISNYKLKGKKNQKQFKHIRLINQYKLNENQITKNPSESIRSRKHYLEQGPSWLANHQSSNDNSSQDMTVDCQNTMDHSKSPTNFNTFTVSASKTFLICAANNSEYPPSNSDALERDAVKSILDKSPSPLEEYSKYLLQVQTKQKECDINDTALKHNNDDKIIDSGKGNYIERFVASTYDCDIAELDIDQYEPRQIMAVFKEGPQKPGGLFDCSNPHKKYKVCCKTKDCKHKKYQKYKCYIDSSLNDVPSNQGNEQYNLVNMHCNYNDHHPVFSSNFARQKSRRKRQHIFKSPIQPTSHQKLSRRTKNVTKSKMSKSLITNINSLKSINLPHRRCYFRDSKLNSHSKAKVLPYTKYLAHSDTSAAYALKRYSNQVLYDNDADCNDMEKTALPNISQLNLGSKQALINSSSNHQKALGTEPTKCQRPGKSICNCCINLQKNVKNRPSWDTLIDDHFDFHQYVDTDVLSDDIENNLTSYKNSPYAKYVQNQNTGQQTFSQNNESDFDDNYSCCKEDIQKTELYNSHDQIYTDTTSTNSSLCSSSREYPYKFGMQYEANDQLNNDQGYSDLSSTSHNDILIEDLNKTFTLTNHNNSNIEKEPLINDNHCGYRLAFDTQTTLSSIYSLNDFNLLQSCYNALGQPENMHNICGNNEKLDHLNMKYDIETVPDSTPFWQSWPPDLENPYSSARQKRIYNTFLKQKMSNENKSNILRTSKRINISLPMLTFTSNTNQQRFESREDYRRTDKAPLTSDHIDPRQNIGNCNNFGIDKTQPSNYKETAPIIINKNCNDTISNINNFRILIKLALENFYQKNNSSAQSLSSAPQSPCKTTKNISTSFGKDNCDNHKDLSTVLACLSESLMLQMLNNLNWEATTNSADAEPNSCDDQTVKHEPHETLYSKCPICQYLNGVANFEKNKIRQKPSINCQANNDLNLMTGTLILSTLASLQLLKVTQESNNTKYQNMGGNTNDEHQKQSYCSILPSSDDHNDTNYNTKMEISNDGNSLNNNFKDYPNSPYHDQQQNESTYSDDPNRVNNNLNDNNNTSSILSLMESSLKLRFGDTFGPIDTSRIENLTDPPFAKDHHNTTKKYGNHDSYPNNLSITVNKVSPTQFKPAFKEIKLGAVSNFLISHQNMMPENSLINGDSEVTSNQLPNLEFLREKWLKLKSFEENAIKSQHFTNFHQTNSRICNIPPNSQEQGYKDDITTDDYSNIDNFNSSNPIYEEVTDTLKNNINNSQISSETQSSDSFSHPSNQLQKDTTSTHTRTLSQHSILKIKKTVSFSDKVCLHEISDSNITPYGTPERILCSGENKMNPSSTKFVFNESASDNFIEILIQLYTYFNLHSTLSLLFECENCDDLPSETWESKLKMAINTNMNQLINLGDNRKHHNLSQFLINHFCQPLSTLILETMCLRGHSYNPANVSYDQCKRIDNQVLSNAHLWRQIKKLVDQTYTTTDTSVSINSNKLSIMNDLITAIEKNKHATTILESKYTDSQLLQEQSFLYAFICGLLNLKQLGHWIEAQFQMENEPSTMALSDNPILCKLLYSLKHLPFRIYLPAIINYPDSISMMTAKGNLEISINPNSEKNVPKRLEVKEIAINLTSSNCSSNESNYNNKIGKNCNYINKQPNNLSHFNVPSSKNPSRAAEITSDQENFKGITTIAHAKIDNESDAMSIFPCKIPKGIQRNPIPSKIPKLYPNRAYMSASSTIIESNLCNKLNSYKKAIGKNNEVEKKCSSAPISPVKDNKSIVSKYNNNGKIVNIWQNEQKRIADTITLNHSKLLLPNKNETTQQLSFIKNNSTNLKSLPFPSENVGNVEFENPSAKHLLNSHKSSSKRSVIECEQSYKPPIQALVIKYKPASLLLKNTNDSGKGGKNDEKSLIKDLTNKTTSPPTNGFQKFRQDLNRRFSKKNVMPRPLSTNLTIPTKENSNVKSNHSNTTNKSRISYPTRTDGLHLHLTSNHNSMVANENNNLLANEKNIYIINANSFVNSKNSSSESGIGSSEAPNLA